MVGIRVAREMSEALALGGGRGLRGHQKRKKTVIKNQDKINCIKIVLTLITEEFFGDTPLTESSPPPRRERLTDLTLVLALER